MTTKRDFGADNLKIACEQIKDLIANPSQLKALPDEPFNAITLPVNDAALLKHNLGIMANAIAKTAPPGTKLELSLKLPKSSQSRGKFKASALDGWQVTTAPTTV